VIPSDIEIRRNYFFKPLSWMIGHPSYGGIPYLVKNSFELKTARRVLIDGNVFENSWEHDTGQHAAILFTARGDVGPWSTIEDVTFTHNIVRHAKGGVVFLGKDNIYDSEQMHRVLVRDNLFEDIDRNRWGAQGTLFTVANQSESVAIEHNTAFTGLGDMVLWGHPAPNPNFVYRHNVTAGYFIAGEDGPTYGQKAFDRHFPKGVFAENVLVGDQDMDWWLGNEGFPPSYYLHSLNEVGFVDLAGGNYRLAGSSPYKNGGSDGLDLGADIDAIEAATAGVVVP
jgi:hypothetical protein